MPSNPPELHLPSAASCVGWMGASRRDRASSGEKWGGGGGNKDVLEAWVACKEHFGVYLDEKHSLCTSVIRASRPRAWR